MPIAFKAPLTSAGANATFVDKTIDDVKVGILGLSNTVSDVTPVTSVKDFLLQLAEVNGMTEDDANRLIYDTNFYLVDGESQKTNLSNLDSQINVNVADITELQSGTKIFREYISDTAYETANGAPTGGEVYYNTTTGQVRYYNGIDLEWQPVGSQVINVQENIGTGNGAAVNFNITNAPLNDEALNVYLNGVLVEKTEYSYVAPTITFNTPPVLGQRVYVSYLTEGSPASPIVSAGTNNVEYYVMLPIDITNKSFTLAAAPSEPSKVLVDIIGGGAQYGGVDFSISGSTFDFTGLGLDGELNTSDVLRIQYFT